MGRFVLLYGSAFKINRLIFAVINRLLASAWWVDECVGKSDFSGKILVKTNWEKRKMRSKGIFKGVTLGALIALSFSAGNVAAEDMEKDPLTYWLGGGAVFLEGGSPNYSGQLYEARLGYDLDPSWTIEAGLGGAPFLEGKDYGAPSDKEATFDGKNSTGENWMLKGNISALYHLDSQRTDGWDPYLSVIGGTSFFQKRRYDSNWEEFAGAGVGVSYWFDKDFAARLDYDFVAQNFDNVELNHHLLALVYYNFNSQEEAAPAPADSGLGAKSTNPLNPVYYDFDKANLTKKSQETLKKNSEWMKANPGKKVSLEGHTDERGTNEYNMALGQRRAKSAEKYLKTIGVPKEQMSTTSYGEELPADPGHNEAAWSKNRRTESVVKE